MTDLDKMTDAQLNVRIMAVLKKKCDETGLPYPPKLVAYLERMKPACTCQRTGLPRTGCDTWHCMDECDSRDVFEHYKAGHVTGMIGDPKDRHLVCVTCNRHWNKTIGLGGSMSHEPTT